MILVQLDYGQLNLNQSPTIYFYRVIVVWPHMHRALDLDFLHLSNQLLKRARSFCLNAMHHVTIYPNTVIYIIILCHEVTSQGVPIAYLVRNYQSKEPVREWLIDMKELGVSPHQITVNYSKAKANAINRTWNRSVAIHLCAQHIVHAQQKNITEKIVVGDGKDKREVINAIFIDIHNMIYKEDRNEFFVYLERFHIDQVDQDTFMQYFEQQWIRNNLYKQWVWSFQEDIFRHMELNMFIESFHNQLKTIYLQRHYDCYMDGLIFLLISKAHK